MTTVGISDKELKEHLIKTVGPDYMNYPKTAEWNLKALAYRLKVRKNKKPLDKED